MAKDANHAKPAGRGLATCCLLVASFIALPFASVAFAGSLTTGSELIAKMSAAMQELDYSGTFVHSHDGKLEAMRIDHSYANGVEQEKLLSLNGEAREVIRNEQKVICIWPGSKTVAITESTARTPFPVFEAQELAQLEALYAFDHIAMDRVAGRDVEVIDIKPLDDYRYGYRLWVDGETFLMLRSAMLDHNGSIIEQVMFTEIEYDPELPESSFMASFAGERSEWMLDLDKQPLVPAGPDTGIPGVDKIDLPDGYSLVSDKTMNLPENVVARRVMYSDGLSSLSVYVAPAGGNLKAELLGMMSMGAVHAYGVMHDQWHVTVVGEVPVPTVSLIGKSVELVVE